MKTIYRRFFAFKSVFCAAAFAAGASTVAPAQSATVYWNEDAPPVTNPPAPNLYLDQGNNYLTTDPTNTDPTQVTSYSSGDAVVFSSDTVGTEAQTLQLDSEDYIFGLEFNKGAITLTDDGGGSSIIDLGDDSGSTNSGITVDSTVNGPTTISPNTINLLNSQQWNNNSIQDLIVGGAINGSVNPYTNIPTLLTFDGSGTGAMRLTGNLASGVGIEQDSTTSTLYLANASNAGVTSLLINGGTVVANTINSISDGGGAYAINLENGGTLTFQNAFSMNANVDITNGGTLNFAGDTLLNWGNGNGDTVTADGGTGTLTLGSGDALDTTRGSQNFGTLDLVNSTGTIGTGYRLIVGIQGQGLGFLSGVSTTQVGNGYTLDFGSSGTVAGTVNFESGSALEARDNVTVTMDEANLPIGGTLVFGNDDVGSTDAIHIASGQNLTGTTNIVENGSQAQLFLDGNLTGSGGLTFTAQNTYNGFGSPVILTGTNTYRGPTILGARNGNNFPVVEINGDSSGIGNEIDIKSGHLILGTNAKLPTTSVISIGDPNSASNSDYSVALQVGDGSVATSATVYDVVSTSTWSNPSDAGQDQIIGTAAGATLTWDVEGANTTDDFGGHIGDGSTGGNNITIVKTGAGTLLLTGGSSYTGGTVVDAGTLAFWGGENFGADQSALGASYNSANNTFGIPTVTMNTGMGTLLNVNNNVPENVVFNTPGLVTINGDAISIAGRIAVDNDEFVTGNFTGGGGVAFTGVGDELVQLNSVSAAGNIYVEGGRVLMIGNNNLLGGTGYSATVGNGAVLDFGMGGSVSENLPVIVENGAEIGDRGTAVTLNDLVVSNSSSGTTTFSIGSDDAGGGSLTVANSVALGGNVQVNGDEFDNRPVTSVNFSGGFSGTGNLSFGTGTLNYATPITNNTGLIEISGTNSYKGDTTVNGGILDLTGNSSAVTSASGGAPNYAIVETSQTYLDNDKISHTVATPGILEIGAGGSLASDAKVTVGSGAGFAYFVLGDNNGTADVTVGDIAVSQAGGSNDNGAILGGASGISTLNVDVAANTTDVYAGIFGSSWGYDFNNTSDGNINNDEGNLAVVFNIGTGGVMDLQGFNPGNSSIAGGFVANGGTLKVDGNAGALGTSKVTLNNTDLVIGNNSYNGSNTIPHVIIGTGTNRLDAEDGIDNFSGDIQSGAGSVINVSGANFIFTSDNTASTIGTLNIDGGRIFLMNATGLNIIAGGTKVNVTNDAFLDFASSTTSTITNAITFTSGTGLVMRDNGGATNITLTNASLPTAGSFTIGADDEGGQAGSYTITSGLALTGDLALHITSNSNIPVTLTGNISGNGGISEDSGGNLYLTGANTYSGQTSATFANLYIDGDNSGAGANYFSNFSAITIGHGGSIASDANLIFGNGGGYGTYVLGDANGAVDQTIAGFTMESSGTSYVYNGDTKDNTNSILTVNNGSADTYTGILGNSSTANGNDLALVKSGTGTLTLTGANTYTGGTTVNGGKLAVNGSIAGNALLNAGGQIGGSGKIGGTISGAGAVALGDPTILTASAVDPSGGMSFNFEFTLTGQPSYGSPTNSGNDVLHLEGGTPFASAMTSANVINFFLAGNGTFDGGVFVNGDTDTLTADLSNASFEYYILNNIGGTISYDGNRYSLVSTVGGTAVENSFQVSGANFADGTTDGYEEQITISGAVIPEPSTFALMGVAGLAFLLIRRRVKT